MMKFKRPSVNTDQVDSRRVGKPSDGSGLGTNSANSHKSQPAQPKGTTGNDWRAQASATSMTNTSVGQMPLEIDIDPLLKDIVFSEDLEQKKLVNRLYRDIYYNDSVCGSAVDMLSTLPFSDFTLGGVSDKRALRTFQETIDRLGVRTILPHLSTDHLVDGAFIGSMLFNRTSKRFFDIMPHRHDNAKIDSLPFYGQDPIITVAIPEEVRATLTGSSSRVESLKERLGEDIIGLLTQDALELDPLTTVYIPRKTFTTGEGVSFFRRILPIYLIEKNLFRGTLVESSRRQRGILHLSLGDGDQWEPTVADMEFMTELFMNADADPLGAIIATRLGVTSEEIRQGGDFWKVTDTWDSTATFKLRAMGISESFLSGDANYATADSSLTVFIESIRAYRDMITRKLFYNKIFPLVSLVNGFTVNDRGKLIRKEGLLDSDNMSANLDKMANGTRLLIPNVHWSKQLKPEGDSQYLDMLQQLTDKGIPVPLRAMAAAGGFNLDSLLADSDDDLDLLKRVSEYSKQVGEIKSKYGPKQEGDDGSAFASGGNDNLNGLLDYAQGGRSSVLAQGNGRRPSLAQRDFGEQEEIVGRTKTGKKQYIHDQKRANERANREIARALGEVTKKGKTPLTHKSVTPKKENPNTRTF
tara:strand:+ start:17579 stop:19501 length:1923 start_codon:yes stop_codon:yes gene_type:complete